MVNLNNFSRLNLSFFKNLLRVGERIADAVKTMPENREKLLSLYAEKLQSSFSVDGVNYSVTLVPDGAGLPEGIEITWYTEERGYKQRINFLREESNLGKGYVYYFLCPVVGRKCRKLYITEKCLVSRYAFSKTTYNKRRESKKWRELDKLLKRGDNFPYRKYGKREYRGKLTPYGEKLLKFYENTEKETAALQDALNDLNSKSRKRLARLTAAGRNSGTGQRKKAKNKPTTPPLFLP